MTNETNDNLEQSATVYVVGNYPEYKSMFKANGWVVVDHLDDADLVQFCGGADVSPALYDEKAHHTTSINSKRDEYEADIFEWCFEHNVPMAGICRGAQFLHVMSGGRLWQNVNRHAIAGTHTAFVLKSQDRPNKANQYCDVSSTHHQMMRVGEGEILVTAGARATIKDSMRDGQNMYDIDVEAMFHEGTGCLCYQPHPEFFNRLHECQVLYFKLIDNYLFEAEGDDV
ncbi:MAG: gamma-glutamyl-gamma-aminobutyrate hydrolase family protein [Candidatus Thorarchaeota archaeon]|jgi:gamma-glutamyl-gamma-aminobutyrate hydrolase PuuD